MWQYFEVKKTNKQKTKEKKTAGPFRRQLVLSASELIRSEGRVCHWYIWQAVSRFLALLTVRGRFHHVVEWAFHERVICNHKCILHGFANLCCIVARDFSNCVFLMKPLAGCCEVRVVLRLGGWFHHALVKRAFHRSVICSRKCILHSYANLRFHCT